jgi:hypothetical protein
MILLFAAPAGPACRPGSLGPHGNSSAPVIKLAAKPDEAARLGWPVRDLPGGHLHMLARPAEVAAAITALAAEASAGVGAAE